MNNKNVLLALLILAGTAQAQATTFAEVKAEFKNSLKAGFIALGQWMKANKAKTAAIAAGSVVTAAGLALGITHAVFAAKNTQGADAKAKIQSFGKQLVTDHFFKTGFNSFVGLFKKAEEPAATPAAATAGTSAAPVVATADTSAA